MVRKITGFSSTLNLALYLFTVSDYCFFSAIAFTDCPIEEPFEVAELFLYCLFFKFAYLSQVHYESVEPVFVKVPEFYSASKRFQVVGECMPSLHCGVSPLVEYALFFNEFVQILEDGFDRGIRLCFLKFEIISQGECNIELLLYFFYCGTILQA